MQKLRTLRDLMDEAARLYRDQTAFTFVGGSSPISYHSVLRMVSDVQSVLAMQGVQPGDKVALYSENMPAWPIVYLAVTTFPAVVVPILPDFPPEDVVNILAHSEAKVLFESPRAAEKIDQAESVQVSVPRLSVSQWNAAPAEENQDASQKTRDDDPASTAIRPEGDDLAAIIYTSGTTGHSKGVMLSHWNIVSNVIAAADVPRIQPGERMLSILPLSHTYECTLGFLVPFLHGASVAYFDRPPSPSSLLKAMSEVRPHLMLSVPIFIEKIVRSRVFPELSKSPVLKAASSVPGLRRLLHRIAGKKLLKTFGGNLRFFGIGGAPLAPDVERFLRNARFPYSIGYGLTETAPLLAGTTPNRTRFRSTGPAVANVQLRLQDGEIQAKGPNVMAGYYRDPERTRETFTDDGWFRTGDLGSFGRNGYLYIKGRSKNVIIGANGENIYPEAIESVINQLRFVADSLVIQKGSEIIARVQVNYDEFQASLQSMKSAVNGRIGDARDAVGQFLEDLRQKVNQQLSAYARINRIVEQKEPFQKTPTLKIKRYLYKP